MNSELINAYVDDYFNNMIRDFNDKQENILNAKSLPETYFNIAKLFGNTKEQKELQYKLLLQELKHNFFSNSDVKYIPNSIEFIYNNLSILFSSGCVKEIKIKYTQNNKFQFIEPKLPNESFTILYNLYSKLDNKFTWKNFKQFADYNSRYYNKNIVSQFIKYIHNFKRYVKGDYKHIITDYKKKVENYYSNIDNYNKAKQLRNEEMKDIKVLVDDIIKTDLQQFVDEGYVISINGIDLCDEYNQTYKYSKIKDAFYKEWIIE